MLTVFILDKKCNLNCPFCICKNEKYLAKEVIISQLDKIDGSVIFTGGEPLIRKDINELCKYAKEKKLKVGINTNGILINRLNLSFVDFVNIPLDGRKEIHDQMRGKGHFKLVLKALETLKRNKIESHISTVATKVNLEEIKYIPQVINRFNNIKVWKIFKFKDNKQNLKDKFGLGRREFSSLKKIKEKIKGNCKIELIEFIKECKIEFIEDIHQFKKWKKIDSSGAVLINKF